MINLSNLKYTPKTTIKKYSDDEVAAAILQEATVRDDVNAVLRDLNATVRGLHNSIELLNISERYPNDPTLKSPSFEAWNISETLKGTLDRFRKFFKKVFNYIGSFVILRINACASVIDKWNETLKNTEQESKDKVKKIFEDLAETKTCSVRDITDFLNAAEKAYTALSKQIESIKATTTTGNADSDKTKLEEMFKYPDSFESFTKMYEEITDKTSKKNDEGADKGMSYTEGKWDQANEINELLNAVNRVITSMQNIKRVQANCDAIVSDLSKPSSDEEDTVKNLNTEKIKFMKKFSSDVLSGMMNKLSTATSIAAKHCNTFNGKYETKAK